VGEVAQRRGLYEFGGDFRVSVRSGWAVRAQRVREIGLTRTDRGGNRE